MQAFCKPGRWFVAILLALPALAAASGIVAVPPAAYVPPPAAKARADARPLLAHAARAIRLEAPSARELAQLKAATAAAKQSEIKRSRAIGIGRSVPRNEREIRGADLAWTAVAEGGVAARVDVASPGARGMRVALSLDPTDPDVTLRVAGAYAGAPVYGPYPANRIAEVARNEGAFWTPVIEGDTVTIEIRAPAGVATEAFRLGILRVSHLVAAGEALRKIDPKDISDIGTAALCEADVACIAQPTQALLNTARSVAKMVFTDLDGITRTCTGTLINDSVASAIPYFFTANHCMMSQARASTLNTYWFFDAVACNSKTVPAYVLLTGGATLLGRSEDYDWALVRLRDAPPAGVLFSAWRAEPLVAGLAAYTMHHPEGDLKKWSQGVTQGYQTYEDGSTFVQMRWNLGSTEPGSSGAGLFTLQANGGYYELRGGLFGGQASCTNRAGVDVFSRLDNAAPLLRQYLTPNVPNPNGEVIVVEFYHAGLDHYFMTSNPAEIADLDAAVHPGWVRTGLRFLAYSNPALAPPGATPVCRFYLQPSVGDSHFYSGDPAECAATAARFGESWTMESAAVFWIVLPDRTTGACPAGLRSVFRFFHAASINHRYTAEVDIAQVIAATPGWIAEGYGPEAVIMCSPTD